jgi:hypothetical protein
LTVTVRMQVRINAFALSLAFRHRYGPEVAQKLQAAVLRRVGFDPLPRTDQS